MIDVLFIISIILINDILVNMIVFITFIRRIIVPYFWLWTRIIMILLLVEVKAVKVECW